MKKTNILYIIAGAILILSVVCFVGCREQKDDTPSDEGTGGKTIDEILEEAKENGPVAPEGEITEIWFDETFNAYYPKQLKDIIFTRIYMYGELESELSSGYKGREHFSPLFYAFFTLKVAINTYLCQILVLLH